MIEKISVAFVNESGEIVPMRKGANLELKIDATIADLFSEICFRNNSIKDEEIKAAEKFNLAKNLNNYLKEMKKNVGTNDFEFAN